VLAFWIWHIPSFYQASLDYEAIHVLEHLSFFGTALLFWWVILHSSNETSEGGNILALFTMVLQGGLLGSLITFAPTPWFQAYETTTQPWGLAPLEDQHLAGATMWLLGGLVYTLIALRLFLKQLTLVERAARKRDSHVFNPMEKEVDIRF
jgi:cytochrome c oxidase assembly factor CtaG